MAEYAFFPLATDAYMADCAHLSYEEHGLYLVLLINLWRAPNQRLPNDNEWLAKRFRLSVEEVEKKLRPVIAEFCENDGNWISQKRITREWKRIEQNSKSQTVRAKSRWKKDKDACRGNASPHPSGNAPTLTPTPTPTKDIPSPTDSGGKPPPVVSIEADVYRRAKALMGDDSGWVIDRCRKAGQTFPDIAAAIGRHEAGEIGDLKTYLLGMAKPRAGVPPSDPEFRKLIRGER